MPLPTHPQTLTTATSLVSTLRIASSTPPTHRPAHAKGRLLHGTFTPTPLASTLSSAQHFNLPSTPLLARLSSSTGLPTIPDTDPSSNPRGLALRFLLSEDGHKHTDLILHSTPLFPVRTGEEFQAMLEALGSGEIGSFVESTPSAGAFLREERGAPRSFAGLRFWGVNAFVLVDAQGGRRTVRWRVVPAEGGGEEGTLEGAELEAKGSEYLFEELEERLGSGPVRFKLLAQVAGEGDVVDDATVRWPEEREVVEVGEVKLESLMGVEESGVLQQRVIFDPIPRVEGVEASGDPLLDVRAAVYLISGRGRRAAEGE